ncbi:MAG: hypothetical protein J6A51_00725, partial [Clostridia bacterium]|nr:hypothetical protein [Clostridia bacterium]
MNLLLFFALLLQVVFAETTTTTANEDELCDFDCFIQNLKLNVSLGDAAVVSNYKLPYLVVKDMKIKEITGTAEPADAPNKFVATILFETLSASLPIQDTKDNNKTIAQLAGTLNMASIGFSLGFSTYDYAGYNLIKETDPQLLLDLNLGDADLEIKATDEASGIQEALFWILNGLIGLFKGIIDSVLQDLIAPLNDEMKVALDDLFYGINKNYTERYINQTHPVYIPASPNLMNLTESPLIDMLAWATTSLLGGNTTLSLNELINRFTKDTGAFIVGTRDDTFENLSDVILDALKFNNISIPDLNATLDFGLSYLELTGLNTWNNLRFFDPLRYSTKYGTDIPRIERSGIKT